MKSKNMTLMVVAIGCGLVAAFLTARLSGGSGPETVDVLVAKKELPVGTLLDEKDLEEMIVVSKLPKASLPPDLITNKDDLKGKKLNRTLKPGNYFAPGDVGPDSGIKIPEGMIKYAVKVDGVKAVAGFVQPGDHVDVQLTESMPNGGAKSGFVLRDVLVLAVDTTGRRFEGGTEARAQVGSVSVAVTPKDSLYLSAAEKRGEVKFVLRDSQSQDKKNIEPIKDIPGFDKPAIVEVPKPTTVHVVVAKTTVKVNAYITDDNFSEYFKTIEIPQEMLLTKSIKDSATLNRKYIMKELEADQPVYSTMLSDKEIVTDKPKTETNPAVTIMIDPVTKQPITKDPVTKVEPTETLNVTPREAVVEGPRYPRKYEQIINNQRVWFLETAPGRFRRVDGNGADLKDVPTTSGGAAEERRDDKKTESASDRPV